MAAEKSSDATPAYAAVLFYLLSYALVKVAHSPSFRNGGSGEKLVSLDELRRLGQRQPWVAASLSVFLLSLLGLPVTADSSAI